MAGPFASIFRPLRARFLPHRSVLFSPAVIRLVNLATRPDFSIRPHLAAGAARIVRRLGEDEAVASARGVCEKTRTGSPRHADRRALVRRQAGICPICVVRPPANTRSCPLPFRDLASHVETDGQTVTAGDFDLSRADAVLVRTMPPGSLEQVVFRMDLLARLEAAGIPVVNPPRAIEAAVDKYSDHGQAGGGRDCPSRERAFASRSRPAWRRSIAWAATSSSSRCSAARGGASPDWRSSARRANLRLAGRAGGRPLSAGVHRPCGL